MSPENLHIVRRRHRKKILHKGEQIAEEGQNCFLCLPLPLAAYAQPLIASLV